MTALQPAGSAVAHEGPELSPGLTLWSGAASDRARRLLPPQLAALLVRLHRDLAPDRRRLLAARRERQARWDAGELPGPVAADELPAARGDWRVASIPADLVRRRVEITGPINDAKMVINMLSRTADGHRADTAMLDFEDSMKPSWANVLAGLDNLIGAIDGTLTHHRPAAGGRPEKLYRLDPDDAAAIMVRCRGLHLDEANVRVDLPGGAEEPVAAGLFDLAAAAFHGARRQLERGRTPKFYIPKCEHYLEARWWNRLLAAIESELGLPADCLRVTFLIETLPAAFQVEEILWEIRRRATALNVGRWDKIFSDIKVLKEHPDRVLADRATISLDRPWMRAYAERLIAVCHRRGAYAMGGMAAFTPGGDPEVRRRQTAKVVADKELEARLGHDGCWVSHPYFIAPAMSAFRRDQQLDVLPESPAPERLLPVGGGPRTRGGLATNVRVGIAYLEGWRRDVGCVAWDGLMEDLATLEISRAQVWQWLHHGVELDDGARVDRRLVEATFAAELDRIAGELRAAGRGERVAAFEDAAAAARDLFMSIELTPFLTTSSELSAVPDRGRPDLE